ncbi:hypothetical protein LCGC14_1145860 [marine sediment metagenome]|uniref:Uncharacterized protein n=1 Tax=marine sediment metagenome TaxID=412755 RepID=A0A0F9Q2K3_9ZZZZ
MANMSYCRFQNTVKDLFDCYESFDDYVSEEEAQARTRMYNLCLKITENFDLLDLLDKVE